MFRGEFFQSSRFQEIKRVLVLEAILVFLFWLLHRYAGFLGNFPFGDVLFIAGGLMLFIAGFGMMRGDTELARGPKLSGPALQVQPTESDTEEDTKQKMSFGVRLAICGGITILISVVSYLFNKAGG